MVNGKIHHFQLILHLFTGVVVFKNKKDKFKHIKMHTILFGKDHRSLTLLLLLLFGVQEEFKLELPIKEILVIAGFYHRLLLLLKLLQELLIFLKILLTHPTVLSKLNYMSEVISEFL